MLVFKCRRFCLLLYKSLYITSFYILVFRRFIQRHKREHKLNIFAISIQKRYGKIKYVLNKTQRGVNVMLKFFAPRNLLIPFVSELVMGF